MQHSPGFLALVAEATGRVREISVDEVRRWQGDNAAFVLVDVREDHEWAAGYAAGAVHLGRGILERDAEARWGAETRLVLYCGGGYRSALAADALQKMGFTDVYSLAGGWKAWVAGGAPTAK